MRILILDDEPYRHEEFARRFETHTIWHTYTVERFKQILEHARPFDVIYLDHDLGTPETGLDAAKVLAANRNCVAGVIIHSWNAPGALAMKAVLNAASIPAILEPFSAQR